MNVFNSLVLSFMFFSCATNSTREKIIKNMLIGAAAGYAVGQLKSENKTGYSLLYAGAISSVVGVGSVWYSDLDDDSERLKKENLKLKTDLDRIFQPSLKFETTGMMNSKVPEKYKSMINPGEWKIYALDQWIEAGENQLIHQDKMMELIPPSLVPVQLPLTNEKKEK